MLDIIQQRLLNQQIGQTGYKKPEEIVSHLVAMQAQEYSWAKWAIGMRLPGTKESDIEVAFNKGLILRTHLLRPTWHFVSPKDIRWLLKLTAPSVYKLNKYMYKKLELDSKIFNRCNDIITKELEGEKHLTRNTINESFEKKKIIAKSHRLSYIFMQAELDGLICSGPREGKQFTYALLEERVAKIKALTREEGLAELSKRYFSSRGPATIQDFSYWSGLTIKEIKDGVATLPADFVKETIEGKEYIFLPNKIKIKSGFQSTFLLPDYDEYGMSYKDRGAFILSQNKNISVKTPAYKHTLIIDGKVAGNWQEVVKNKKTAIEYFTHNPLSKIKKAEVQEAIKCYQSFRSEN